MGLSVQCWFWSHFCQPDWHSGRKTGYERSQYLEFMSVNWDPCLSHTTSNLGVMGHLKEKVVLFTTCYTYWTNNQRDWKIQMGAGGAAGLVITLIYPWATSMPGALFQPPQYKNVWLLLHFYCPNLIQVSLVANNNLELYR